MEHPARVDWVPAARLAAADSLAPRVDWVPAGNPLVRVALLSQAARQVAVEDLAPRVARLAAAESRV
jgi:hypothetical protein